MWILGSSQSLPGGVAKAYFGEAQQKECVIFDQNLVFDIICICFSKAEANKAVPGIGKTSTNAQHA
jgi:hypothetical protein